MAEYIEREATNADVSEKTKIKTHFAHVIVERYHGKPYYNILYFDPTDKEYHIGFGSFSLDYVFKWLDEEFEIVEAPAADVVERKRGRWIWDDNAMDWGLGGWVCSECQEKNDNIPAKPDINPYGWVGSFFCPNCGADMREVDDAN